MGSYWTPRDKAQQSHNNMLEPTSADHSRDVLYTIKKSECVGRYMVAARDIKPGETIFMDQPAVIGPDNSSKPMCLGCFRKVSGIFKCSGCNWPMCREACTRSPYHVNECSLFRRRGAKINVPWFDKPCTYYDAILPLRVLLLKLYSPKLYHLICLLMDHNDGLDEATVRRRQTLVDFLRKSCRLGDDFSNEEVHKVLGILSVNSFVVHDGGADEANTDLIGLYPWTSLMSHNCIANTKITTREDFSYVCEATVFIRAGEEIVTNYHHYHYQFYGTPYRRLDLKSTWSFDCTCPRCKDPTEAGTYVSAIICESCKFGNVLPIQPTNHQSDWKCNHCGVVFKHEIVSVKVAKFETEIEEISSNNPVEFERLLRKMRYFLHENHYWILDVKRRLIDIYGNKEGYELYKLPKETLELKADYCEHLLSVATKLCPGPSEMRGYLLWEWYGVRMRLAQWHWIRMKISTPTYLDQLIKLAVDLRDVVAILGPIRRDSDEGQIGLKARQELRTIEKLIEDMSRQTFTTSTSNMSSPPSKTMSRLPKPLAHISPTSSATLSHKASNIALTCVEDRGNRVNRRFICT